MCTATAAPILCGDGGSTQQKAGAREAIAARVRSAFEICAVGMNSVEATFHAVSFRRPSPSSLSTT